MNTEPVPNLDTADRRRGDRILAELHAVWTAVKNLCTKNQIEALNHFTTHEQGKFSRAMGTGDTLEAIEAVVEKWHSGGVKNALEMASVRVAEIAGILKAFRDAEARRIPLSTEIPIPIRIAALKAISECFDYIDVQTTDEDGGPLKPGEEEYYCRNPRDLSLTLEAACKIINHPAIQRPTKLEAAFDPDCGKLVVARIGPSGARDQSTKYYPQYIAEEIAFRINSFEA